MRSRPVVPTLTLPTPPQMTSEERSGGPSQQQKRRAWLRRASTSSDQQPPPPRHSGRRLSAYDRIIAERLRRGITVSLGQGGLDRGRGWDSG